jgi:hypothetical protein
MDSLLGAALVPRERLALALAIDLVAISAFAFGIYYRRHRRREMAMVYWFFNLCLFVTVAVIQMTEVAAALGFGLFAILSIIRLRSETFSTVEIGYFFGALVLGLVNGVGTTDLWFVAALNVLIVASMLVLDHQRVMPAIPRYSITFDRVILGREQLQAAVESRLGMRVVDLRVNSVDLIRESMELEVSVAQTAASRAGVPSGAA